jgi:hypothetical protein
MSFIFQRRAFDDADHKMYKPSLTNLSSLDRNCRRRLMRRAALGRGGGWSKQQSSKNQNACPS